MTIKGIMKKSRCWYTTNWLILVLLAISLIGCEDNDNPIKGQEVTAPPYDPSKPILVSDFLPKEGGMGQRLVIYGENFGNDPNLVKVKIGGKEAKVINVLGNSLYCLVPRKAIAGDIEIQIDQATAKADSTFGYIRKRVVSSVVGYKNERNDQGWREGKFKDPDINKMAAGFSVEGVLKFDPKNDKHLWMVCDHTPGLYLINFEDSTMTRRRDGFNRPRAIDFTLDGKHMLIAEDRPNVDAYNISRLSRSLDFKDKEGITQYRDCNTVAVHPVNGEMYFNSYEKGQFFRYDLNAYFEGNLGEKDYESLFFVHDPGWEYRIHIHPSGNYAYILVVNQNYVLRADYNWEKKRFNQPYIFAGKLKESGYVDGVGTAAKLNRPYDGTFVKNPEYVAANKADVYDYYIADCNNHAIRVLTEEGSLTTFAGRGSASINANPYGYVDGDLREEARFDKPTGIAYNEKEDAFYILDFENRRLRKIALEEMDDE